jgi:hypothetical protein
MSAVILTVLVHVTLKAFRLAGPMASDCYEFKWHNKGTIHSTQESFGLGHTEDGQNNGNTKKLRNRICLCWLH